VQIEASTENESTTAVDRVIFSTALILDKSGRPASWSVNLDELRQLMLGFDVDPKHTAKTFAQWSEFRETAEDTNEIRRQEDEILNIFVDICSLFRRKPSMNGPSGGEAPSREAYLFTYLRMIQTQGEGLPPEFIDALRRVLAHYGIATLNPTPALEETLLWIYKSHQHVERQIAPILGVLGRRLPHAELERPDSDHSFRTLLDRLIAITRESFPAVSDLAREVRYRCFDHPVFERARKLVYEETEEHLAYLAANPSAPDRKQQVSTLIDCPQPLVGFFSGLFTNAEPGLRQLMLEVLTSRYYRAQSRSGLACHAVDGHAQRISFVV
jgi:hypothetical protein